ncbi:MAG: 50S ribosomal protein L15, partial [Acaryochloridaceae cyanobacterium SU_2_1]|nr:50S ribosomal protein L15 [Acaryochloridaceae cyanobacterium SU_2_1]
WIEGGKPSLSSVPKLKHFTLINQKQYTTINVGQLNTLKAKSKVTLASLMEVGIVTSNDGPLKLLGEGELTVALTVEAAAATQSAIDKITTVGGSFEVTGSK